MILLVFFHVLVRVLDEVFSESGFLVNWALGKTEAIFNFRGKGASTSLNFLNVDDKVGIKVKLTSGEELFVHCVFSL